MLKAVLFATVELAALWYFATSGLPLDAISSKDILDRLDEMFDEYEDPDMLPTTKTAPASAVGKWNLSMPSGFKGRKIPMNLTSGMFRANQMPYYEYYDQNRCKKNQCFLCYDCRWVYAKTDVCYTDDACVSFIKATSKDRAGMKRGTWNRDRGCAGMHVRKRNYTLGEICLHMLYMGEILMCEFCYGSWCNGRPNFTTGGYKIYKKKDAIRLLFGRKYKPRHSNNTPPPIPTLGYTMPCKWP